MPIKRRKAISSRYVYVDEHGRLNVKVPYDCVNWDEEFRLRISHKWISPMSVLNRASFMENYVSNGWSDKMYRINRKRLRIYYKVSELRAPRNALLISYTVVENIDTRIGIALTHPEFSFRNLQIYEFVTDTQIGGVPAVKYILPENEGD